MPSPTVARPTVTHVEPRTTATEIAAPKPAKLQPVQVPALPPVEVKVEVPSLPPLPVEPPKVDLPVLPVLPVPLP